jgi:hypothetical protein
MNNSNCTRTVHFKPYRKGCGPVFTLKLFYLGLERIGYQLTMREQYNAIGGRILFEGSDFRPSPLHSIDGNEAVKAILCFLTCRPGDTDREYFADYTPAQLDYCSSHAEALSCEVMHRFGE